MCCTFANRTDYGDYVLWGMCCKQENSVIYSLQMLFSFYSSTSKDPQSPSHAPEAFNFYQKHRAQQNTIVPSNWQHFQRPTQQFASIKTPLFLNLLPQIISKNVTQSASFDFLSFFSFCLKTSADDRVAQGIDFILGVKHEDCRCFIYDYLKIVLFNNILFYITFKTRPPL